MSVTGLDSEELPDKRWYGGDLPEAAERELAAAARLGLADPAGGTAIAAALRIAPERPEVRIAAYKYYFYRHELDQALPHAAWCVRYGLDRLGADPDWQRMVIDPAELAAHAPAPRFVLFALKAYGYVLVRLGRVPEGRAALLKVATLDPADLLGAARLLAVVDRGPTDPDGDWD